MTRRILNLEIQAGEKKTVNKKNTGDKLRASSSYFVKNFKITFICRYISQSGGKLKVLPKFIIFNELFPPVYNRLTNRNQTYKIVGYIYRFGVPCLGINWLKIC